MPQDCASGWRRAALPARAPTDGSYRVRSSPPPLSRWRERVHDRRDLQVRRKPLRSNALFSAPKRYGPPGTTCSAKRCMFARVTSCWYSRLPHAVSRARSAATRIPSRPDEPSNGLLHAASRVHGASPERHQQLRRTPLAPPSVSRPGARSWELRRARTARSGDVSAHHRRPELRDRAMSAHTTGGPNLGLTRSPPPKHRNDGSPRRILSVRSLDFDGLIDCPKLIPEAVGGGSDDELVGLSRVELCCDPRSA